MIPQEETVTMIGATGCGKTTYLVGMYASLSQGVADYFLFTEDPDLDLDLSSAWEDISTAGKMPPPNELHPLKYPFVFRRGLRTVLRFSWEDYRGGAMSDRLADEEASDAPDLHRRLAISDGIFVVLDGTYLTSPVTPGNKRQLSGRDQTLARRMSTLLDRAVRTRYDENRALPSLVVLVTKADLIRQANPGQSAEQLMNMIVNSARELLPSCFLHGTTTLVCPVQIGVFGADQQGTVEPGQVDPRNLHLPLVFSFLYYLDGYLDEQRGTRDELSSQISQDRADAERLRTGLINRIFRGEDRARLLRDIDSTSDSLRKLSVELDISEDLVTRLSRDLEEAINLHRVAAFEDGIQRAPASNGGFHA
jgi:hypothetical protein